MKLWRSISARVVLIAFCAVGLGKIWAGAAAPLLSLEPVDLGRVKVGGEIGRRIDLTLEKNLLALDVDKDFLAPFKDRTRGEGFIGLGMLIDSVVKLAAYSKDARVLALKDRLIGETIALQLSDGYLGMLVPASRMWNLWDVHEMAYLIHGLSSDYRHFGNQESLNAARRTADYILARWSAEPDRIPGEGAIAYHMAVTGLDTALLELHKQTGDERYLRFCVDFLKLASWDSPIVNGRWGNIEGHAYAYMSRCLAQLRLNRIRPNPILLNKTKNVLDYLSKEDGLVITGTCGNHECWHDSQDGGHNLAETCTTAYLLRFLDEVFQLEGESLYGDIMERAIYNALFAAQSPDGRRIRYYTPFEAPRVYFEQDTYCCPNNYRRILAELPTLVYYKSAEGIAVNLYTASKAEVELREGLTVQLTQATSYPDSGRIELTVKPSAPSEFTISFRVPKWCSSPSIVLNGETADVEIRSGTFASLRKEWRPDDKVELNLPMDFRFVKGRKAQSGRVAVLRGPRLFALAPSRNEGLEDIDLRMMVIKPETLEGPIEDNSVREGGLAYKVEAWKPESWYPMASTDFKLLLTEYADPESRAAYFLVPNPENREIIEDELIRN